MIYAHINVDIYIYDMYMYVDTYMLKTTYGGQRTTLGFGLHLYLVRNRVSRPPL